MAYVLTFAQFRPSSRSPKMLIGEKKTHRFNTNNAIVAELISKKFLKQRGRVRISLLPEHAVPSTLQPDPAFLPPHPEYVL
ncbi:MAG: hypothetical protein ACHQU0_00110 [Candidatus Paceibacteria bacterium]